MADFDNSYLYSNTKKLFISKVNILLKDGESIIRVGYTLDVKTALPFNSAITLGDEIMTFLNDTQKLDVSWVLS